MAINGKRLKPPSMMLVEDACDHRVRGIGGDGEDGVADGVDQEHGVGDGVLHLVDGDDHLLGDGELLLGHGQGVRQRADDVGKAGQEVAVEVLHPQQPLDIQRMTPAASISAKAALAAANFSSERGLTFQWMGVVSAVSTVW